MNVLQVCFYTLLLVARYYFFFVEGALTLFLRVASLAVAVVSFILFGQLVLKLFTSFF